MAKLIEINDDSFDAEVIQADIPVLVDFGAVWCGPCKMLDPVVEELADDWAGKVKFTHIDVDHNPNITMQFNIMGVPTLILFKAGEPVARMSGYKPKAKIIDEFGHLV
jgi:thioredoxin 1